MQSEMVAIPHSGANTPPTTAAQALLVLVGIQGSGKSTFASELTRSKTRAWVRINQVGVGAG